MREATRQKFYRNQISNAEIVLHGFTTRWARKKRLRKNWIWSINKKKGKRVTRIDFDVYHEERMEKIANFYRSKYPKEGDQ